MKLFIASLLLFFTVKAHATFTRLDDDAFTPEQAEETAFVINNNFSNFWATKVDVSTPPASGPSFFVSDLLNPDMAERNAMIINQNFDDLWREKIDFDGIHSPGGRNFTIGDYLDPENVEETIFALNSMFDDLDNAKVDAQ